MVSCVAWAIRTGLAPARCDHPAPRRHRSASRFTSAFDGVFPAEGIQVLRTPCGHRAPTPYAERWVGTVRREVLDRMLIFGCRQLRSVLVTLWELPSGRPAT